MKHTVEAWTIICCLAAACNYGCGTTNVISNETDEQKWGMYFGSKSDFPMYAWSTTTVYERFSEFVKNSSIVSSVKYQSSIPILYDPDQGGPGGSPWNAAPPPRNIQGSHNQRLQYFIDNYESHMSNDYSFFNDNDYFLFNLQCGALPENWYDNQSRFNLTRIGTSQEYFIIRGTTTKKVWLTFTADEDIYRDITAGSGYGHADELKFWVLTTMIHETLHWHFDETDNASLSHAGTYCCWISQSQTTCDPNSTLSTQYRNCCAFREYPHAIGYDCTGVMPDKINPSHVKLCRYHEDFRK